MKLIGLTLTLCIVASCREANNSQNLASSQVSRLLDQAYIEQDSSHLEVADSIYNFLWNHVVSSRDSIDIANGFIFIKIAHRKTKHIRQFIDFSVPANVTSIDDRFFRSISLFHTYLIERKCDSANIELNRLYKLVENEGASQLNTADLDQNKYALLMDCYGLPDSARNWALDRGLSPSQALGFFPSAGHQ